MYWAAFIMGLLGSLHCLGMCGPIAFSLPGRFGTSSSLIASRLLYNGGRIAAYGLIGIFFGLIGATVALFAYQQVLSIATGSLILLWALSQFPFVNKYFKFNASGLFLKTFGGWFKRLYQKPSVLSLGLLGILNGFLPCGLVYLAALTSLNYGQVSESMVYMIFFGLGTVPMMFTLSFSGKLVNFQWKQRITAFIPYAAALIAVLFILRGLALGIPYVSPNVEQKAGEQIENQCCSEPDHLSQKSKAKPNHEDK